MIWGLLPLLPLPQKSPPPPNHLPQVSPHSTPRTSACLLHTHSMCLLLTLKLSEFSVWAGLNTVQITDWSSITVKYCPHNASTTDQTLLILPFCLIFEIYLHAAMYSDSLLKFTLFYLCFITIGYNAMLSNFSPSANVWLNDHSINYIFVSTSSQILSYCKSPWQFCRSKAPSFGSL